MVHELICKKNIICVQKRSVLYKPKLDTYSIGYVIIKKKLQIIYWHLNFALDLHQPCELILKFVLHYNYHIQYWYVTPRVKTQKEL